MVTQAITAQVKFFMHFFALAVPYILVFIYLHGDFEVYFIILFFFFSCVGVGFSTYQIALPYH